LSGATGGTRPRPGGQAADAAGVPPKVTEAAAADTAPVTPRTSSVAVDKLAELLNGGQLADAESLALRLLELERGSGALWKLYGLARTLQGKEALRELQEAARLLPGDPEAQFLLGNAQRVAGNLESAAQAFQAALLLRPGLVQAGIGLAAVLAQSGRLAQAVVQYQRVVLLNPESVDVHNDLGNLLMRLNRTAEAVAAYREAVRIAPRNAAACTNLGNALRDLGDADEALQYLRVALEIEPGIAAGHYNLGGLLLERAYPVEAEACYRRALELEPQFPAACTGLALALLQQGRKRDAETACRRSLELEPVNAAALALFAEFVADRGEYAEAERLLRRALEIDPEMPEALAGMVRFRRMGAADQPWLTAARGLLERGLVPRQELALRFAAGKFLDDRNEPDAAFENYRRANELRRWACPRFDPVRYRALTDRRIATYTREWMDSWKPRTRGAPTPVFTLGMPRSGVSLIAQMLGAHPGLRGAGELQFWSVAIGELENAASGNPATDYGQRYLRMLSRRDPGPRRPIDSLPGNFANLGLIHACLPDARFIHVRRHAADTCLSVYFQNFTMALAWTSDLGDIAAYYREYRRIMEHWRTALPAGSLLEIDLEDLAQDAGPTLRRVLDFLGLPWNEACLHLHTQSETEQGVKRWQVSAPIGALEVGRWRRYREYLGPVLDLLPAGEG
jgi:tetratricopeptide (TPR) repeat protein